MNKSQFQKAAGISAGLAARWFPHIDAAMKEFGITAPLDQAMFIAQMGHESGGYKTLVESLNYAADRLVPTFGNTVSPPSRPPHSAEQQRNQLISEQSRIWCMGASGAKRISVIRLPVMAGNIAVAA